MATKEVPSVNETDHGKLEQSETLNRDQPTQDEEQHISEDDMRKLRHVHGKLPWAAYTVMMLEIADHLSLSGTLVVSQLHTVDVLRAYLMKCVATNFIQWPLPPGSSTGAGFHGQSGALGRGQQVATSISIGL